MSPLAIGLSFVRSFQHVKAFISTECWEKQRARTDCLVKILVCHVVDRAPR